MSMVLSEEQQMLKDMAAGFFSAKSPISEFRSLRDTGNTDGFSAALWQDMVDMGWASMPIPEAFDGLGFEFRGVGIVMEEAGRSLAASPMLSSVAMGVSALLLGGSDAQKTELLPKLASGARLVALAVDESGHHDPTQTAMVATQAGDGFRLHGRKRFVLDAARADHLIVVARTEGEAGSTTGLSLFLVDAQMPGVTVHPRAMVDCRSVGDVHFDLVEVTSSALVGDLHQGMGCLDAVLDRGRAALAAEMLGSMERAFELILAYLKERKQFGQAIGGFQALQHRAAKMFSDIEVCRSVVYEAFTSLDAGREDSAALVSMAKALVNDAFHNISNEGVQMFGGMGMTDECDMGFYLKRARVAEQTLGSSKFHRDRYAALNAF